MTFGVTDDGLLIPRLQDLLAEFESEMREEFGSSIVFGPQSVEGQFTGMTAERVAKAWEALEVLGGILDEGKARGRLLEALSALTGTYRRGPTYSVVALILAGDDATVVPGTTSKVSNGQPAFQFQTIGDATLDAVDAWDDAESYTVGDLVSTGGNVYYCRLAADDTIAEPTHTERFHGATLFPSFPTPGYQAAYWIWLGAGDAAASKNALAVTPGPVFVASGDTGGPGGLDTIDTPVSGWSGVFNPLDVTSGANAQSDEDLSITRSAEIAALGTSPPDALRGRLLKVGEGTTNPVTAVTIFRNVNDVTDGDGLLPHRTEAMIRGGDDDAIRAALWASVASGLRTQGNVDGTIFDSEGNTQVVQFSRATEINIYVAIELTKDPLTYPSDGDAQIKAIIVAAGLAAANGIDVNAWAIGVLCAITGVIKVTSVKIGTAPAPTLSVDIVLTKRQRAAFDTSRIAITAIDGTY